MTSGSSVDRPEWCPRPESCGGRALGPRDRVPQRRRLRVRRVLLGGDRGGFAPGREVAPEGKRYNSDNALGGVATLPNSNKRMLLFMLASIPCAINGSCVGKEAIQRRQKS